MGGPAIRAFGVLVSALVVAVCTPVNAHADPVPVFPGMEIHQGAHLCTLGYVDPGSAGGIQRGPLPQRRPGVRQGEQGHRQRGHVSRQHAQRCVRQHRPGNRRLRVDRAGSRRDGEQHPARWAHLAVRPRTGRHAWRTDLPFRRRHAARVAGPSKPSTTAGSPWDTARSANRATPAGRST